MVPPPKKKNKIQLDNSHLFTQLNGLTIQFNKIHLFALSLDVKQLSLIQRGNLITPDQSEPGNNRNNGVHHILPNSSLIIACFCVIS